MAQSKCFFNDVKEELECPVCKEQFSEIKDPKILKCLHTFCKACLEKLLRRHGGGDITCPLCRRITDCPNNDIGDVASNLFFKRMVEIVEAYSGQEDHGTPPCGNCEKSKPLRFHCFHCNYFLCTDCAEGHKNFKVLRGHRVKEIGQFKSNDYEDFARRGNVCHQHKEELKFYCVQCEICICRDCAILLHREHKFITFEEALEMKTSEIETKISEVEANSSRLENQKKYLEERMAIVKKSVEQAKDEVDRVAEQRINSILEHQANVTARLVERASEVDGALSRESLNASGKMMEIERCLKFAHEVLARNNLLEILNVKEILEQRLEELSMPFQPAAQLNYSQVKYISNCRFPSSDTLGKLVSTKTEPSLTVAEGIGTAESLQGDELSFTVTTKDLEGHVTYSEIDNVVVDIKFKEKASDIKANITDLKDGRYTVCYKPDVVGEYKVSIQVNGESILGSPFLVKVRPQRGSVLSGFSRFQQKEKVGPGSDKDKNGEFTGSSEDKETMDSWATVDVDRPVSTSVTETPLVTTIGKVTLSVSKGDITNEQVDVIVNDANDRLIHATGVARAICDKGGWSIQEESNKIIGNRGQIKIGEVVATGAGNLPCKMVIHAVGPMWNAVGAKKSKNFLRLACLNSFQETQKHKMNSIALPAISSGLFGMPKNVCAKVMFNAVDEFVGRFHPENITDIRFVNIDDPTVEAFKKEFLKRFDTSQEEMQRNTLEPTAHLCP